MNPRDLAVIINRAKPDNDICADEDLENNPDSEKSVEHARDANQKFCSAPAAVDPMKLYIGNQPDPKDRLTIDISAADYAKIPPRGSFSDRVVTVTDTGTGNTYRVQRGSCGLPHCRCAVLLADEEQTP